MIPRFVSLTGSLALAVALAAPAYASELIARNAQNVTLAVDKAGYALVSYTARGKRWRVLAWGAVNAVSPTRGKRQVEFRLDYSGGWGTFKEPYWKTFEDACRPDDGPQLAWPVAACKAPDGSHWALQAWQRALPNYGLTPTPAQAVWELRLSHWRGPVPVLTISLDWSYRRFHHLYGSFTYRGWGVYGFRSTHAGVPLDDFGRNVYVDTFNSVYGRGWRRENSFLTHRQRGTFCYGFYPHGDRPDGTGERYRATVRGPGVLPDVMWEGRAPGHYDREADLADLERQRVFLKGDNVCKPL